MRYKNIILLFAISAIILGPSSLRADTLKHLDPIPNGLGLALTQSGLDWAEEEIKREFDNMVKQGMEQECDVVPWKYGCPYEPREVCKCELWWTCDWWEFGESWCMNDVEDFKSNLVNTELRLDEDPKYGPGIRVDMDGGVTNIYFTIQRCDDKWSWKEFKFVSCKDSKKCESNWVKFQEIHIDGFVELNVVDGRVEISIPELYVNLITNWLKENCQLKGECSDADWICETLLDWFIDFLEPEIADMLKESLTEYINELFAQIPYEGDVYVPCMEDVTFHYDDDVTEIDVLPPQGPKEKLITYIQTLNTTTTIPPEKAECVPEKEFTPTPGRKPRCDNKAYTDYHTCIAISENTVNQVLYNAYDSGFLCMRVDDAFLESCEIELPKDMKLNSLIFQSTVPELFELAMSDAGIVPVIIETYPISVPWVKITTDPSNQIEINFGALGPGKECTEYALVTDYYMVFEEGMRRVLGVKSCVWAEGGVEIVGDNNSIKINIGDIKIQSKVDWEDLIDVDDTGMEKLMPKYIENLLPKMIASIGEIELPDFECYVFETKFIEPDDPYDPDYLDAYGDLRRMGKLECIASKMETIAVPLK